MSVEKITRRLGVRSCARSGCAGCAHGPAWLQNLQSPGATAGDEWDFLEGTSSPGNDGFFTMDFTMIMELSGVNFPKKANQ